MKHKKQSARVVGQTISLIIVQEEEQTANVKTLRNLQFKILARVIASLKVYLCESKCHALNILQYEMLLF